MSTVSTIQIGQIRKTENALREVNKETESFLEMVASVADVGVLNPISVRETEDEDVYDLVDGRHRLTAAIEAGLAEIPCLIFNNMSDHDQLKAQLIANACKVETRPAEFGKQIRRLLEDDPTVTKHDIAKSLSKSPQWIEKVLRLTKLPQPVADAVDQGHITMQNALALAELPADEQGEWLDRAMSLPAAEFVPIANERAREIKEENRAGKKAQPEVFKPSCKTRKGALLIEEFEGGCPTVKGLCASTDEEAGAAKAIAWVVSRDEETVAEAEATWNAKKEARDEAKERRDREKREKAAEKANLRAAELNDALAETEAE